MKNYWILAAVVAVSAWVLTRGQGIGQTVKTAQGEPGRDKSRGIKNNNPGNISRGSNDAWRGLRMNQTDPDYLQFTSAGYGLRALAILLRNYQRIHGLVTVRQIVTRFGPKGLDYIQTIQSYITFVSKRLGVRPDDIISLSNNARLIQLMQAVVRFENGTDPYSQGEYKNALTLT